MKAFSQHLPDSATIEGLVAVCLADRGSVIASWLDLREPVEIASVLRNLADCGWPTKHSPIDDLFTLNDDYFDDHFGSHDFVDRKGIRCDCRDLRQHLRHLVDQDRSYRRLVIQDTVLFLLMCLTPEKQLGSDFIASALSQDSGAAVEPQVSA